MADPNAADGGLYEGLPPDATVDSVLEDPGNPGWAFVKFSDGRESTLPTNTALAMPQTPTAPPTSQGTYPGEIGPPLPPEGPPLPPPGPAGGAPGEFQVVPPVDPSSNPNAQPVWAPEPGGAPAFGVPEGLGYQMSPDLAAAPGTLQVAPTQVGTGQPTVPADGGFAAIAQPATAGGFGPFSQTSGTTTSSDVTAESPEAMQARLGSAVQADAQAAYDRDLAAYDASVGAKHTAAAQLMEQEVMLQRQRREHELTAQEHAKFIDAIESNPIDEDGFWTAQPGRRAGAWVALALSGFLQGVSRGANPMLGQMVSSLQNAQASWMQNQRAQRDSVLKRRTAAMGDERAAVASLDMQLNGIMTKYVQLQSDAAGVPVPPGLATYVAERQLKMAERQNEIGRIVTDRVAQTLQSEQRATPGQPALRRGDVVLRNLGLDPTTKEGRAMIDEAWDPNRGNVPGAVESATRLQTIRDELQAIKAKYDGLPQQNRISWSGIGAEGVAARLGSQAAKDQVRANALILEAQLMLKQAAGTTKLFDSNQEREDLLKQLDTREPETTMRAIDTVTTRANGAAVQAAQRYTRDPQGLIDFIRESRGQTLGVSKGEQPRVTRELTPGQASPAPAAGSQPSATAAEAGAASPLGPAGTSPQPGTQGPPSALAPATSTTASLRGTYRQLRASRLSAPR